MSSSLGALIAAARRRITQFVLERAARHHLSAQQFWLIVAVHEAPGISQVELSDRTMGDAASISRALSCLCDRGVVELDSDPADRRRSRVRLTPRGERLAVELLPVARELRDAMMDGMSPADVRSLQGGLERLVANLDELGVRRWSA